MKMTGAELRRMRRAADLTQKQVADHLRINHVAVCLAEQRGTMRASTSKRYRDAIAALAKARLTTLSIISDTTPDLPPHQIEAIRAIVRDEITKMGVAHA